MPEASPCILGVDCGVTGALAFYWPQHPERVLVEDMPVVGKEVDAAQLADVIARIGPDVAVVEKVHAMPKNGSVAAFSQGCTYTAVRVVLALAEVRTHLVTPASWKKFHRLGPDKDASRELAKRMFPAVSGQFNRVKDHNRAEASLIALYGAEKMLRGERAEAAE